jgi:hypothetical protein
MRSYPNPASGLEEVDSAEIDPDLTEVFPIFEQVRDPIIYY